MSFDTTTLGWPTRHPILAFLREQTAPVAVDVHRWQWVMAERIAIETGIDLDETERVLALMVDLGTIRVSASTEPKTYRFRDWYSMSSDEGDAYFMGKAA